MAPRTPAVASPATNLATAGATMENNNPRTKSPLMLSMQPNEKGRMKP